MLFNDPLKDKYEKKATRDGYGEALVDLGGKYSDMVVLEADLSGSTKTKDFSSRFPDRFYNFGVAEQNMVGNAAGMSRAGLVPFASSFAMFLTGRAWEVVRNTVAYPGNNVKLVATHAGITLGEDGASHQTIEDVAIMRAIPGMTVIVPSDFNEAYLAVVAAYTYKGPVYIRLGRPSIPLMYSKDHAFKIGKADIIQKGKKVAFIANGIMVFEAWKAAKIIENEMGVTPYVINMSTVKPLDAETLSSIADEIDMVVTLEEHNIMGGLGSAVAEYYSETTPKKIIRIGMADVFGQSGTPDELLSYYGLTAEKVVQRVKQYL